MTGTTVCCPSSYLRSSKLVLATVAALVWLAVAAPAALAHPGLIRSDPPDAAVLANGPREVRLWFSEPISEQFSTAQLLDLTGQVVPQAYVLGDLAAHHQLVIGLPDNLPNSVYSVDWKVLSDADGHVTRGHIVFGVGQATAGAAPSSADSPQWLLEIVFRWLNLFSLTAVVGALGIYSLVLPGPSRDSADRLALAAVLDQARRRVLLWTIGCAAGAILVGFVLLGWQVVSLGSGFFSDTTAVDLGRHLLSQTRWGTLWLARQGLLLAIVALLARAARLVVRGSLPHIPVLVSTAVWAFALGVLAVQALGGHAAALPTDPVLATIVDTMHLAAASLWMGGLVALLIGFLPSIQTGAPSVKALAHIGWPAFSRVAATSVLVLLVTGLYGAGREVASIDGLLTTLYGQALLMKASLAVAVGGLGLLSLLLLRPGRRSLIHLAWRHAPGWLHRMQRWLPKVLAIEAGLGLALLLATAIVTSTQPPNGPEFGPSPPSPPDTTASQTLDDLLVGIEVKPNIAGPNVLSVRTASSRRPQAEPVSNVFVRFQSVATDADGMESTWIEADRLDSSVFRLGGDYLSHPGPWRIDVDVVRSGQHRAMASFAWSVSAPSPAAHVVVFSNQALAPHLTGLSGITAALFLVLTTVNFWWSRRRLPARRRKRIGRTTLLVEFVERE